MTNPTQMNLP